MALANFTFTIVSSDDVTPDSGMAFKIYNDADGAGASQYVEFHETGTIASDPDVTLVGSTVTISNVTVSLGVEYNFKATSIDGDGVEKECTGSLVRTFTASGTAPVLSNFTIEDTTKLNIDWVASSSVSGMTQTGFTISGKTLS